MTPPSFRAGVVGPIFFVRWLAPPRAADANALLDQLASARARVRVPLIFCAILSNTSGPPEKALRSRLREIVTEIRRHCDAVHVALESDSVVAGLARTVIRGALVAARLSGTVSIHDSVASVLQRHVARLGTSPEALLAEARGLGFL